MRKKVITRNLCREFPEVRWTSQRTTCHKIPKEIGGAKKGCDIKTPQPVSVLGSRELLVALPLPDPYPKSCAVDKPLFNGAVRRFAELADKYFPEKLPHKSEGLYQLSRTIKITHQTHGAITSPNPQHHQTKISLVVSQLLTYHY